MKATSRLNGQYVRNFETIKELRKYLNEALYYCNKLYLIVPKLGYSIDYQETNDIASLIRDVRFYGDDFLEVVQDFNEGEE